MNNNQSVISCQRNAQMQHSIMSKSLPFCMQIQYLKIPNILLF